MAQLAIKGHLTRGKEMVECLLGKEETNMKENTKLNLSAIDYNNGLVGYEIPEGYEFDTVIDNKVIIKKLKPKYPKTYEECCEVLMGETNFQDFSLVLTKLSTNINEENSISPEPPHITLINNFYKLLICRDAYWKIAEDWKPDWTKADERKYCIANTEGNITKWVQKTTNKILAFPTEEMRDAFYVNFRELVESVKELL